MVGCTFRWINLFCQCYQIYTCEVVSILYCLFWYLHDLYWYPLLHCFYQQFVSSLLSVLLKVCQSWQSYFKSNKSWFHFLYFQSHGFLFFFFPLILVLGLFCSIILESWGASLGYWSNLIWDLLWLFPLAVPACTQYYKGSINTDMLYFHIHYYVFLKVSLRLLLWHMNYLYMYCLISKCLEIFHHFYINC